MKFTKNIKAIILIFAFALVIRVVNIYQVPPAFYGDELTIAYDTYSILKTGHDQLGDLLPITFPMGAGRPGGYIYFSLPFVALFGMNELGVRGLAAISGALLSILMYLIGRKLLSVRVGLISAVFFAISPWSLALSMGGFEANFALLLSMLGLTFILFTKDKPFYFIYAALAFGLSIHTYPTFKLVLPLFLPLVFWYLYSQNQILVNKKSKISLSLGIALLVLFVALSASQTFIGGSEDRFKNINIFAQQDLQQTIIQKVNSEINLNELPKNIAKIFQNKPVEYLKIFIDNYLQNFSINFLFLHGDGNPRHNMGNIGQMYFVDLIFVLLGFTLIYKNLFKTGIFLLLWILISPLATAFISTPHALRSCLMLPPLILFSAYGFEYLLTRKTVYKYVLLSFLALLFILQFSYFIQKIYFLSPNLYPNFWSVDAKVASQIALANKDKFNYIILSDKIDNIEFAYPVYAEISPEKIISQNKSRSKLNGYLLKKIDNIYIGYIPSSRIADFLNSLNGSVMYVGAMEDKQYLKNYEIVSGKDKKESILIERRL